MGLELYAKVEPLLGFEEQKSYLYELFLQKLSALGVKKCLDVGCGSGLFMQQAQKRGIECIGIDLSKEMVKKARSLGLRAYRRDLCEIDEKFEAVTAIFDVINYLDKKSLQRFFGCVKRVLEPHGYFLCDMNTLYGFQEVAQGALIIDKEREFVAIDAEFEDNKLITKIDYFYQIDAKCYKKEQDTIIQYYHNIEELKGLGLELVDMDFVALYGDEVDKVIMTWKRK